MASHPSDWGSDVRPSGPVAPLRPRLVQFGGFCMTDGGIAMDISESEAEEFRTPTIAPYHKEQR